MDDLVEPQLGSFDTCNCQLLLEREGLEGTLMGPGVGGQAESLTVWGWALMVPLLQRLYSAPPTSAAS